MGERNDILALWRRAQSRGERVALATIVRTAGSSYRKPGARMLVTSGGERAGTLSGGCLEGEVSRKIWWLTAQGPSIRQYRSSFEDDDREPAWGLGCGGTVWVHLEQEPVAVLHAISEAEQGTPKTIIFILGPDPKPAIVLSENAQLDPEAALSMASPGTSKSVSHNPADDSVFIEALAPPPRLTIFGAGDDSIPIAEFAAKLGWRLAVADGRAHLLQDGKFAAGVERRRLRFDPAVPTAHSQNCCSHHPLLPLDTGVTAGELAVVLTHSYDQDRAVLASLLPVDLLYLGILGPRHRTARLLHEIAPVLGWSVEQCFARLHSPVGLDLGARDPAAIALAIVAELQAVLAGRHFSVSKINPSELAFAAR